MVDAFTGAADFSGIDGTRSPYVGAVVHEAFVDVNEAGTEAAAATGVEIEPKSTAAPAEIHFDRPYLLFIRDIATGHDSLPRPRRGALIASRGDWTRR